MAHIGVHRLASGDGEEDRAEHCKSNAGRGMDQIDQCTVGTDRLEDRRGRDDPPDAEDADHDEPQQHQGPKDITDERGALSLNEE